MFRKQITRKLSASLVVTLLTSLLLPTSMVFADEGNGQDDGSHIPIISTVPAANATVVRPDTSISLKLDPQSKFFKEWTKKFEKQGTLSLIDDGGQAVYAASDSEWQYNADTGVLTFTPPTSLHRYTTYGVLLTPDKLPDAQVQDPTRKKLPKQPDFITQAVDDSDNTTATTLDMQVNGQAMPSVVQNASAPTTAPVPYSVSPDVQKLLDKLNQNKQQTLQNLQAEATSTLVGPKPVKAINPALKPIDKKDGGNQKGMIERIEGSVITLFGGTQFTVTSGTHIHVDDPDGPTSIANLHPGDEVIVTVNDHSDVTNVNVTNRKDAYSFVFQTGSDLHEPTHVTVEQQETRPRVTDDGHFTLVSTDDYGLPAWGSETQIDLGTNDGSTLSSSAAVEPSSSFVTNDSNGSTAVTVVDHKPQQVVAKVSMDGPYHDGYDAHGFVVLFDFRPGLPAIATINAPQTLQVANVADINGTVTDVYGNPVEDGSEIDFTTTAGTVGTPVYTTQGTYDTAFAAPTKVQDVTLNLASAEGTATATATIHLLPGEPAIMTMDAPDTLQAGDQATVQGTVTDRYGNAVMDGTKLMLTASAGQVSGETSTTNGNYQETFTAPTRVQTVTVSGLSEQGSAAAQHTIQIVPGPAAILSLQAQNANLNTGDTTALSGLVADQYENVIDQQQINLTAQHGTLSNANPFSDVAGLYATTYTAPFYNGIDTVTAVAGAAQASVDLNISSAGSGYNPTTGQIEPVASIKFDHASYNLAPNQISNLTGHAYDANGQPLQGVVFSAEHATGGMIQGISYQTDANGVFTVTYQASASAGTANITVDSATIEAQTTVQTSGYGFGYDPQTGQWEPVGSIVLDPANNVTGPVQGATTPTYNMSLLPGNTVQFTGHALSVSGHPLSQVQFDKLTATAGTLQISQTDANGQFSVTYVTPSTEGNQMVQIGSGNTVTTVNMLVSSVGNGVSPTGQPDTVAHLVFTPNLYTVTAGASVTLTGKATDASGQPVRMAKLLISVDGGTTNAQVITQQDGSFTLTYIAPTTVGTYHVTAKTNQVSGMATIQVVIPQRPHFSSPSITLTGGRSLGNYYYVYLNWSGTLTNSDGTPDVGDFVTLDEGPYNFIDYNFTDDNGFVSGGPIGMPIPYSYYTYNYGVKTYYASLKFTESVFDLYNYVYLTPSYTQTFNLSWR